MIEHKDLIEGEVYFGSFGDSIYDQHLILGMNKNHDYFSGTPYVKVDTHHAHTGSLESPRFKVLRLATKEEKDLFILKHGKNYTIKVDSVNNSYQIF